MSVWREPGIAPTLIAPPLSAGKESPGMKNLADQKRYLLAG
jgi:hypothetical protein